jgi:E1-E2 ATPase
MWLESGVDEHQGPFEGDEKRRQKVVHRVAQMNRDDAVVLLAYRTAILPLHARCLHAFLRVAGFVDDADAPWTGVIPDFIPADMLLQDGQILADQSSLTGESTPKEIGATETAYAGSVVRGGEATGEVTATGRHTFYGKTAELAPFNSPRSARFLWRNCGDFSIQIESSSRPIFLPTAIHSRPRPAASLCRPSPRHRQCPSPVRTAPSPAAVRESAR